MSNFKTFSKIKFCNMKTFGLLEYHEKPVELIINTTFSIIPTKRCKETFNNDLYSFQKYIRKNRLGQKILYDSVKDILYNDWKLDPWCGVAYTYNHDINEISFNNQSNLGVDFLFILPYKQYSNKIYSEIKEKYKKISKKISMLNNFVSDENIKIVSCRKNI